MTWRCSPPASRSGGPACRRLTAPRSPRFKTARATLWRKSPVSATTKCGVSRGWREMFTGLISDVGQVRAVREEGRLRRLRVSCGYDAATIDIGASIAHAGVCLTVVGVARAGNRTEIEVEVGAETLGVTTAGQWRV